MKLAALVYCKKPNSDTHHMLKLFEDGSSVAVAPHRYAVAIRFLEAHGYRALGYWLNNGPAIVWARQQVHFETAWGRPELRAPVCFGRRNGGNITAHQIGDAGYILPTRTRFQVHRLRQEYPTYPGDLLMVPSEVLYRRKRRQEERDEARQQKVNKWLASRDLEKRLHHGLQFAPGSRPAL